MRRPPAADAPLAARPPPTGRPSGRPSLARAAADRAKVAPLRSSKVASLRSSMKELKALPRAAAPGSRPMTLYRLRCFEVTFEAFPLFLLHFF